MPSGSFSKLKQIGHSSRSLKVFMETYSSPTGSSSASTLGLQTIWYALRPGSALSLISYIDIPLYFGSSFSAAVSIMISLFTVFGSLSIFYTFPVLFWSFGLSNFTRPCYSLDRLLAALFSSIVFCSSFWPKFSSFWDFDLFWLGDCLSLFRLSFSEFSYLYSSCSSVSKA